MISFLELEVSPLDLMLEQEKFTGDSLPLTFLFRDIESVDQEDLEIELGVESKGKDASFLREVQATMKPLIMKKISWKLEFTSF